MKRLISASLLALGMLVGGAATAAPAQARELGTCLSCGGGSGYYYGQRIGCWQLLYDWRGQLKWFWACA